MPWVLDEVQAEMLEITQQLREISSWLEAEAPDLDSVPVDRWQRRLAAHTERWDQCLGERGLLPKGENAEREQVRRAFEHVTSKLAGDETEERLLKELDRRLEQLSTGLQRLLERREIAAERSAIDAMMADVRDWRRITESAR